MLKVLSQSHMELFSFFLFMMMLLTPGLTQLCMDAKDPKVKPAKSLTQLSVSHSPGANSGLAAPAFISELYRGGDAPLSTSMLGIHSATPRHSSSQGQTSAAETLRLRLRALNGSVNQTSDTPRDISIASAAHRYIVIFKKKMNVQVTRHVQVVCR